MFYCRSRVVQKHGSVRHLCIMQGINFLEHLVLVDILFTALSILFIFQVINYSSPTSAGAECIGPDCTWVEQW